MGARSLVLRPDQQAMINGARREFSRGNRAVLLVAVTGFGKSVTAGGILRSAVDKGQRCIFFAHRNEILNQARATFQRFGLRVGLIVGGKQNPDPLAPVQVAAIATAARREPQPYDLVIVDEAHRTLAAAYLDTLEKINPRILIGLTATPARLDGKPLGDVYQAIVEGPTLAELIDAGNLSPVRYFAAPFHLENKVRTTAGDYNRGDLAREMARPTLIGDIVKTWERHARGRSTVAFTSGIAHAEMLRDSFREAGHHAEVVSGKTPRGTRAERIEAFTSGKLPILLNADLLTEGFDSPRTSCVILARPTKSTVIYRQAIGRGLRTFPGKTDCIVLDHAGCIAEHGHILEPVAWTLEGKRALTKDNAEKYPTWQCEACYAIHPGVRQPVCPHCGEVQPKKERGKLETVAGELAEVTGAKVRLDLHPQGWHRARITRATLSYSGTMKKCVQISWETEHGSVGDDLYLTPKARVRVADLLRSIGRDIPRGHFNLDPASLVGGEAFIQITHERYKRKQTARVTFRGYRRAA